MTTTRVVLAALFLFLAGCSQSTEPSIPLWVNSLISKFQSEPVGNPPQSIWQYQYKGQTVYYVPPQCCDQFSQLFDARGNYLCAPDGGFSGTGDGRCPGFFQERSNEKLIWRDQRTR